LDVQRDSPLAEENAIAQSQLDNDIQANLAAKATVQADKAAIEQSALNLEFTNVRSLIDGIAGIATGQVGNLVGPQTLLTTVSQLDPIKAYFVVNEQQYLAFVQRNPTEAARERTQRNLELQLITADGSAYPKKGKFYAADRQVDVQTGAIRLAALFPNSDNVLRPGQYGRVRFVSYIRPAALLIPQKAVTELQGTYQVAVVGADDKVDMRTVQVGERVGNLWIIEDGLKAGERVVTEGVQKARQGVPVKIVATAGSAEGKGAMSKFFTGRPIVAMVTAIITVIVGAVTIIGLPIAQFPQIAPPEIQVLATYVGADAQTLEQAVATPIEQQMSGVDNANYMYSLNATGNSQTSLIVNFDVKTDPNNDLILAQSRETQAASQLPVDVTNYGITVRKS